MLDIKDFSRKLFARHEHNEITDLYNADLMDCVTVLPFPRTRPVPININTAGKDALLGVLGLDHEDFAARKSRGAHAFRRKQAVLGGIGSQRKRLLVVKGRCRHGGDARERPRPE